MRKTTRDLKICNFIFFIMFLSGTAFCKDAIVLSGQWEGIWVSEKTHKEGKFQFVLKQEGRNISGDIVITGSSVTKGGEISGAVNGNTIEFGLLKDNRGKLLYTGTISKSSMAGTWEIPILKDRGRWKAKVGHTEGFLL